MSHNKGDASLASSQALPASDNAFLVDPITSQLGAMLDAKLVKFSETLNSVPSRLEKIDVRFTEAEQCISNSKDKLKTLKADLTVAKKTITKLIEKSEELENRSRRGNIHTLGLKEGIEGRQPALFFETFLPKALGLATDHGKVKLDGAHRTGPPRQQTLHSRYEAAELLDKEKIQAAVKAAPFYIRLDLSTCVVQQRRSFNGICSLLIQKNIRLRMAFPATLSFSHDCAKHIFTEAEDAQALMKSRGESSPTIRDAPLFDDSLYSGMIVLKCPPSNSRSFNLARLI